MNTHPLIHEIDLAERVLFRQLAEAHLSAEEMRIIVSNRFRVRFFKAVNKINGQDVVLDSQQPYDPSHDDRRPIDVPHHTGVSAPMESVE